MANFFAATDNINESLDVVCQVAKTLLQPVALQPSSLPVTNAVSCATVVLLSGYFESFLKDITREFIELINVMNKPISVIPYEMRAKHFLNGGYALIWAAKQDKKAAQTAKSEDLARRLASLNKVNGYELAWESFADTQSNPGPEVVSEILSGLQVAKAWTEINSLVTEHGQLNTFLTSFIAMRNVCAHTGRHSNPPTGQILLDYSGTFRALAECIDFLLWRQLEEFRGLAS